MGDDAPRSGESRLHALSRAVFLGAFLVEHLVTNAAALGGQASFDGVVGALARSRIALVFEVTLVWLPLAHQLGSGLLRLRREAPGGTAAEGASRRLWLAQRLSGLLLLAFLLVHLVELRLQRLFFGLPADALHGTLAEHLSSTRAGVPWTALFYVAGLAAASFHLVTRVVWATEHARRPTEPAGRRRVQQVTAGLAALCFLLGTATVVALATGTRLLPGRDADTAPCGTDVPALAAPTARP